MELQYKKEERQFREKQLANGAVLFTHVRPFTRRTKTGAPISLRNGYTQDSQFGPRCTCINSRRVDSVDELTPLEVALQVPEFQHNMSEREWAVGPLEVLIVAVNVRAKIKA